MRRALSFAVLVLVGCGAGLSSPALDPLPAQTSLLTLDLRGHAAAAEVEVEVLGAEATLVAPVQADGRFRVEVPLLADVRNRLRVVARSGDEISPAATASVDQLLRDAPRVGAAPAPPIVDPLPATVPGAVVRVSGQADPGSAVWIVSPVEGVLALADAAGRFAREVAIRPGVESWLVVTARDSAGSSSEAALVTVASEAGGADLPPTPALDPIPLVTWRTAITVAGAAPGATRVQIEGGAFTAAGPVGADGRFAIGVALVAGRDNLLIVRARSGSLESGPVVWRVRQTGQGPTRWPLVLVPGSLALRDAIGPESLARIQSALEAKGYEVHALDLPQGPTARRAAALREAIDRITSGKVDLVAHSLGGLDARLMIARLGMGPRVASLTTIATPHRGTPVADVALRLLPGPAEAALDFLMHEAGCDPDCARGLTVSYMRSEFNAQVQDDPRVAYFSWGGTADPRGGLLSAPLWLPHAVIREYEGPNDGLVSPESARWGTWRGTIAADHAAAALDVAAFYAQIAAELAARGF